MGVKGQFFLTENFQLINCTRNEGIWKLSFEHHGNCCKQGLLMNPKIEETGYLHVHKALPPPKKNLLITKGKILTLWWRNHLTKWLRLTLVIISHLNITHTPRHNAPRRAYHLRYFFPKIHNFNWRKHQEIQIRGHSPKYWPVPFRSVKIIKDKDWELMNCRRLRRHGD